MVAHHSEMHKAMHTALFAHDPQHPPAVHTLDAHHSVTDGYMNTLDILYILK